MWRRHRQAISINAMPIREAGLSSANVKQCHPAAWLRRAGEWDVADIVLRGFYRFHLQIAKARSGADFYHGLVSTWGQDRVQARGASGGRCQCCCRTVCWSDD